VDFRNRLFCSFSIFTLIRATRTHQEGSAGARNDVAVLWIMLGS
jgi:hypothetical protein